MIKRIATGTIIFVLLLMIGSQAEAVSQIRVVVNGEEIAPDVQPIVQQSRVLIPLRVVMEELGAKVVFDTASKTITVTKAGTVLLLPIGSKTAQINNSQVVLDVPAMMVANRTMVPLRFIGQALGCSVLWQEAVKTVLIDSPVQLEPRQVEGEIFRLVNEARLKNNLLPLVLMDELSKLALSHSRDMAENNFFSHTSPSQGNPLKRAQAAGLPGTAENIAAGYPDAGTIFQAWMDSPTHRANILDPDNRYIGIGYFQEEDDDDPYQGVYCTQEFIKGQAALTMPHPDEEVSEKRVMVQGYALDETVVVTIYKLLDRQTFSEKYTVELPMQKGTFEGEIVLRKGRGLYALQVSDYDFRFLTYK